MADVATPAAIDMSLGTTNADNTEKTHKPKPEKPDEAKYKADLAEAEKEHAAAQEKLVRLSRLPAAMTVISTYDFLPTAYLIAVH